MSTNTPSIKLPIRGALPLLALAFLLPLQASASAGVPEATYLCNQYTGSASPQFFGYLKITSAQDYGFGYTSDGPARFNGSYRYDGASREITWQSGMFKNYGWPAQFVPAGETSRPRPGFTTYTPKDPTIRFEAVSDGKKILMNCGRYGK